jgi:aspartate aminotransferase
MTEQGVTPVFEAVRLAQEALEAEEKTKVYLPPAGDETFLVGMQALLLGEDSAAIGEQRVATIQTPGGCGALRLGAEVVRVASPGARVWMSAPTWANHLPLMGSAGLETRAYRYYDKDSHEIDFDGMMADLAEAQPADIVLLHGCCHNPCGADLTADHWRAVATLAAERGFTPFIDFAYQGLGDGLEEDAWGLRHLVDQLPEVIVAASCSKNLGLYRERTGAVLFVTGGAVEAEAARSQALVAARRNYSMPPAHGALLAGRVLSDASLGKLWREELSDMCARINGLRGLMVEKLNEATGADFGFIQRQRGMFSFLGLTEDQVNRLREEHSVYMLGSSRVNVAGVNSGNIDYLAQSLAAVLKA